jgi:parallel beta-helix repeat protein
MVRFFRVIFAMIGITAVLVAAGAIIAPFLLPELGGAGATDAPATQAPTAPITGAAYVGNPKAEAALVTQEAARVVEVRSATASATGARVKPGNPYRVLTQPRATLVLPARILPYTLRELASVAPNSVAVTADGGYLVKEHLSVLQGATLDIGAGQRVLLASDPSGFSSLLILGGALKVAGTPTERARITSWNASTGAPDLNTADGRAYVQVNQGSATIAYADIADLGFWSGQTGGLALIGGTQPDVQAAPMVAAKGTPPTVPLTTSKSAYQVRAALNSVTVTGDAYGVYATRADSLSVAGSAVSGSLVDGIVLAEGVERAVITDSTSSDNAVDGIDISQAGRGLKLVGLSASRNGRNGLTLDGSPLAEGPNTSGNDVGSFGGYSVRGGTFDENSRYGIEVDGGVASAISGVRITGGDMGLVLLKAPARVALTDNIISGASRQGISIRGSASGIRASGNRITGGDVGIYLRSSNATIVHNTVTHAAQYGMTLVGSLRSSQVFDNRISGNGAGTTAINTKHAFNVSVERNLVNGWVTSRSLQQVLATIFQPLTILWSAVLAVVALAIFLRLGRGPRRIRALAEHAPLQSMSRGVFDRAAAEELTS